MYFITSHFERAIFNFHTHLCCFALTDSCEISEGINVGWIEILWKNSWTLLISLKTSVKQRPENEHFEVAFFAKRARHY